MIPPADAALVEARCAALGIAPEDHFLILAPRPWKNLTQHLEHFADTLLYAAERYGWKPVLLAMEPLRDRAVCRKIAELLEKHGINAPIVETSGRADETVGLICRSEGVLGMRLHALIFAVSQNVPFAGVAYDPKVSGFVNYMGRGDCCSMEELNSRRLREMVDGLVKQKPCCNDVQHLQELAKENCRIAVSLLERGS